MKPTGQLMLVSGTRLAPKPTANLAKPMAHRFPSSGFPFLFLLFPIYWALFPHIMNVAARVCRSPGCRHNRRFRWYCCCFLVDCCLPLLASVSIAIATIVLACRSALVEDDGSGHHDQVGWEARGLF
jgi:hypothetical protein